LAHYRKISNKRKRKNIKKTYRSIVDGGKTVKTLPLIANLDVQHYSTTHWQQLMVCENEIISSKLVQSHVILLISHTPKSFNILSSTTMPNPTLRAASIM
jgi:hypothetical protein